VSRIKGGCARSLPRSPFITFALVRRLLRPCGASSDKPTGPCQQTAAAKAKLSGGSPAVAQQSSYSIGLAASRQSENGAQFFARLFWPEPRLQSPLLLRAHRQGLVACHMPTPYHNSSNCIVITVTYLAMNEVEEPPIAVTANRWPSPSGARALPRTGAHGCWRTECLEVQLRYQGYCSGARRSRAGVRVPVVARKRVTTVEPRGTGK